MLKEIPVQITAVSHLSPLWYVRMEAIVVSVLIDTRWVFPARGWTVDLITVVDILQQERIYILSLVRNMEKYYVVKQVLLSFDTN